MQIMILIDTYLKEVNSLIILLLLIIFVFYPIPNDVLLFVLHIGKL